MEGRVWATISTLSANTNTTGKSGPTKHDSVPSKHEIASPLASSAHESNSYIYSSNPNFHPSPSSFNPAGTLPVSHHPGVASSHRHSSSDHGRAALSASALGMHALPPVALPGAAPSRQRPFPASHPPTCSPLGVVGRRARTASGRGRAAGRRRGDETASLASATGRGGAL
jgi:hypothetical protein